MVLLNTSPWAYPFLMCLTLSLTIGLEPILDKTEVADGDRLSITCDVHRIYDGITRCDYYILHIQHKKPNVQEKLLAYYDGKIKKNVPEGRNWTIEFTKGNQVKDAQVAIIVYDAICSDAGFYTCECFGSGFRKIKKQEELKRSPTCDLTTTKAITSVETSSTTTKKPMNASAILWYPQTFFLIVLAVIVVKMKFHVTLGAASAAT